MPALFHNNTHLKLKSGINILGRDPSCDIFIPDPHISRKHLSIDVVGDGTLTLIDLGSTNGLYVEDKRVPSAILNTGEKFSIGQAHFEILD